MLGPFVVLCVLFARSRLRCAIKRGDELNTHVTRDLDFTGCRGGADAKQLELLKVFRWEFVQVIPGKAPFPKTFVMGRNAGRSIERPGHEVTIREPFSIAKYEVPQNLWEAVMGNDSSRWKGPRNSAEMLSFDEAQEFCRRATDLMRSAKLIEAAEVIRLPSEAEWEYAAALGHPRCSRLATKLIG